MKSFLIACAVVMAFLIVPVGAGIWWVTHAGKRMVTDMSSASREIAVLNRDFKFVLPPGGKLAEDRLVVWLKAREKIAANDKKNMEQIDKGNVGSIVGEAINMIPILMKAFAQTLRESRMSLDEYVWIYGRVIGALKSPAVATDPKMADLARLIETSSPYAHGNKEHRPQYTPLAPADAQPVLDLLRRREAEFRKVASITFSDTILPNMQDMVKGFSPGLQVRTVDLKTTRTVHAQ